MSHGKARTDLAIIGTGRHGLIPSKIYTKDFPDEVVRVDLARSLSISLNSAAQRFGFNIAAFEK